MQYDQGYATQADKEFAETGDYDVYSGGTGNTNQTYSTPAPSYSYAGSDEEDKDNERSADSQ